MAFYYDQEPEWLLFRVGIFEMIGREGRNRFRDAGARVYLLADYLPGGATHLPDGLSGSAPDAWELALRLDYADDGAPRAAVLLPDGRDLGVAAVRRVHFSPAEGTLEASIPLPADFRDVVRWSAGAYVKTYDEIAPQVCAQDGTPIAFHIFSTAGGRILDTLGGSNLPLRGDHNVAFEQHGNQGLTWSTVFRGEREETPGMECDPANPDDGFDELLALHECYSVPGNFHLAATLQTSAAWHDPDFNDWLVSGVTAGWAEMTSSAYAQHIMPFVQDGMNNWAVNVEKQMTDWRYGSNAKVAWVPERVWVESPDSDGNAWDASCGVVDPTLADNWMQHGIEAVLLDDYIHCGYYDNALDDRHIYTLGNGLKVIPMDGDFVGAVNWDWGAAWNMITGLSSDELLVYGNDWEFCAEVSQGAVNPDALNNYINIIKNCSTYSATVSTWRLSDALNHGPFYFSGNPIVLQNGTYGLLGGHGGYGGNCNSWYVDWAGYAGEGNSDQHDPKWNYGAVWNNTWTKLLGVPTNDLSESGWYTMMSMLHETGWHDDGQVSGWIHHYSNHIKNANAYAEAARWADGLYVDPTGAFTGDFDEDGGDELVIYNERLMAVFESVGGKANYIFAKGGDYSYSVAGNCPVYWVDTDGDYNETNHVAPLSDVSVGGRDREHDFYDFTVVQSSGDTVVVRLSHPAIEKTITLVTGQPYARVTYRTGGAETYVKCGWAPDMVDLIWNAELTRIWGDGGTYYGQQNPNTNATAAVVAGSAGATHNLQFSATLLEGDEFRSDESFECLLYAGFASTEDGAGHVAELEALAAGFGDELGPLAVSGIYYPGPDRLVVFFDQAVQYDAITLTGISVDDDDDGIAEVTLSGACTVATTGDAKRIEIDLDASTAAALEALATSSLELMLAAGAVLDTAGNPNPAQDNTADVTLLYQPATGITIDGFIDTAEWTPPTLLLDDGWDSDWTTPAPGDTNEIVALYYAWDETYLYLAVHGKLYGNSWLLYLDTDPGGPEGEVDLTAIDAWDREATFSCPGFRVDHQFGAYQHQSPDDSNGLWTILSSTTTEDISAQVVLASDPNHYYGDQGGSELAIPWDVLYELGPGNVPVGAAISVVCSICWDAGFGGELGGDSAPSNITASLPELDNCIGFSVDADNDGHPDPPPAGIVGPEGPVTRTIHLAPNAPNPFGARTTLRFEVPSERVSDGGSARVRLAIFDVNGRMVRDLFDGPVPAGQHELTWDARDDRGQPLPAGAYMLRAQIGESEVSRKITLLR